MTMLNGRSEEERNTRKFASGLEGISKQLVGTPRSSSNFNSQIGWHDQCDWLARGFFFWLFSRICGRSENKLQLKLIVTIYKLKSSSAFPMIRNDDFFSLSNRVEGNQSLILADRGGNPRS